MTTIFGRTRAIESAAAAPEGDWPEPVRPRVACFTPGTRISTARGEVAVERLRVGDRVTTRDNGYQEIRWTGSKSISGPPLRLDTRLHPVRLRAGALGDGLPERDLLLSPGHRVLIEAAERPGSEAGPEAFVTAQHLVGTRGVAQEPVTEVRYLHFMCDRHEVVLSNGAWTESFRPGKRAMAGAGDTARDEIFALFPELRQAAEPARFAPARPILKGGGTRRARG